MWDFSGFSFIQLTGSVYRDFKQNPTLPLRLHFPAWNLLKQTGRAPFPYLSLCLPCPTPASTNTCTHPTSRQVQSQTSLNKVKQRHKQCQNRRVGDGLITRLQTQNATRNPTEEQLAVSSLIRTVVVDERTDQKCGAHILTLFVNPASDFVRDLSHPEWKAGNKECYWVLPLG